MSVSTRHDSAEVFAFGENWRRFLETIDDQDDVHRIYTTLR